MVECSLDLIFLIRDRRFFSGRGGGGGGGGGGQGLIISNSLN